MKGINPGKQFTGIGITIGIAIVGGFATGKIVSLLGTRTNPYDDEEEFEIEATDSPQHNTKPVGSFY